MGLKKSFSRVGLSGPISAYQRPFLPLPAFRRMKISGTTSTTVHTGHGNGSRLTTSPSVDLMTTEILLKAVNVKTCTRLEEYLTDGTKGAIPSHF